MDALTQSDHHGLAGRAPQCVQGRDQAALSEKLVLDPAPQVASRAQWAGRCGRPRRRSGTQRLKGTQKHRRARRRKGELTAHFGSSGGIAGGGGVFEHLQRTRWADLTVTKHLSFTAKHHIHDYMGRAANSMIRS